jgi:hypothetical protein
VTVTELHPNGKLTPERRAEIVRQIVADGGTPNRKALRDAYGGADGSWGNTIRLVRAENGNTDGNGAAVAAPVGDANVPGEAPRPVRSTPATVTKAQVRAEIRARHHRVLVGIMIVVAALVAGAVGTLSYSLSQKLAAVAGTGWHAYVVPVALDGMYVCGAVALAVDPKYRPAKWAIGIGLVASSAVAWIAAADPTRVVDLELTARTMLSVTPWTLFFCIVFILHAYKEADK